MRPRMEKNKMDRVRIVSCEMPEMRIQIAVEILSSFPNPAFIPMALQKPKFKNLTADIAICSALPWYCRYSRS